MKYNTTRPRMIISEYGRNVQGMIDYAQSISDRADRTRAAFSIVEIMVLLNPQIREQDNYKHKLWDHLFQMADFKLDIDAPFPMPDREVLIQRPTPMKYPTQSIRYRHYGKNIEKMIEKALSMPEDEAKKTYVEAIGNFMKMSYKNWNKAIINDEDVFNDLRKLSAGKLEVAPDTVLESNFQSRDSASRHRFQNNKNRNQQRNNPNQKRRPR